MDDSGKVNIPVANISELEQSAEFDPKSESPPKSEPDIKSELDLKFDGDLKSDADLTGYISVGNDDLASTNIA